MANPSRFGDSERLQFLIDHPELTVMLEEATLRWAVVNRETREPVSSRHDSARAALDDAMEHQQLVQSGLRAP